MNAQPTWNRWLVLSGVIIAAVVSSIVGLGGPRETFLKVREVFNNYPHPEITNLGRDNSVGEKFVVSIANPGLQQLLVTGYQAEPAMVELSQPVNPSADGAGLVPLVATVDRPSPCDKRRIISFTRPLAIDGGRSGAVEIHPWNDPTCEFFIRVRSNRGLSAPVLWSPAFYDQKGGESLGADIHIFGDGIVE